LLMVIWPLPGVNQVLDMAVLRLPVE